jgi:hypothetical protein
MASIHDQGKGLSIFFVSLILAPKTLTQVILRPQWALREAKKIQETDEVAEREGKYTPPVVLYLLVSIIPYYLSLKSDAITLVSANQFNSYSGAEQLALCSMTLLYPVVFAALYYYKDLWKKGGSGMSVWVFFYSQCFIMAAYSIFAVCLNLLHKAFLFDDFVLVFAHLLIITLLEYRIFRTTFKVGPITGLLWSLTLSMLTLLIFSYSFHLLATLLKSS